MKLFPTAPVVLKSKACAQNNFLQPKGNIKSGIPDSLFHSAWLVDCIQKLFDALLVQATNGVRGIITLLIPMASTMSSARPRERNILETEVLYACANMAWRSRFQGVPKSPAALAVWLAKRSSQRSPVGPLQEQPPFSHTLRCTSTLRGEGLLS